MAYTKIVHVHHGGRVVPSSCGVEFVEMTSKVFFFPHSPTLRELVVKIETALGWLGTVVGLQGRYDAGGCRSYTQMIPI